MLKLIGVAQNLLYLIVTQDFVLLQCRPWLYRQPGFTRLRLGPITVFVGLHRNRKWFTACPVRVVDRDRWRQRLTTLARVHVIIPGYVLDVLKLIGVAQNLLYLIVTQDFVLLQCRPWLYRQPGFTRLRLGPITVFVGRYRD